MPANPQTPTHRHALYELLDETPPGWQELKLTDSGEKRFIREDTRIKGTLLSAFRPLNPSDGPWRASLRGAAGGPYPSAHAAMAIVDDHLDEHADG